MSAYYSKLVENSTLKGAKKEIMLMMADRADSSGGRVYYSHGQIAKEIGYSESTVKKARRELRAQGLLTIYGNMPFARPQPIYRLNKHALAAIQDPSKPRRNSRRYRYKSLGGEKAP